MMTIGAILCIQDHVLAGVAVVIAIAVAITIVIARTLPVAAPAAASPVAAAPSAKLRPIDLAAFAIIEFAFSPVGTARKDSQSLHFAIVRINAEQIVSHDYHLVSACK